MLGKSTTPLVSTGDTQRYGAIQPVETKTRKHVGVFSAVFIIFNRMIGTGIFATPATVLLLSGSVGLSLSLWLLGALYAAAGMHVYVVWGTAFPKNGGEKNYLAYMVPRPRTLVVSLYGTFAALMAWAAGNSLIFGEYILRALNFRPSPILFKFTSFFCVTAAFLLHGLALKWGLRLQNALGVFKVLVIVIVIGTGFGALWNGIPSPSGLPEERWRGRANFDSVWEGSTANASSICLGLYSVIWSFAGFSNANYIMSEMHNPERTIRIAGPLAIGIVNLLYLLSNIAYFAGGSKDEIVSSGRVVVSMLMRNIWGEGIECWVDICVALSAFGNVLAVSFAQGRVNQELGLEEVLPFSELWASNKPYNTPLAGLGLHWLLCTLVIFFVPPGDAYNFVINAITYPLVIINAFIAFGLLYLFFSPNSLTLEHKDHRWHQQSFGALLSSTFFGIANVFLFVVPLMKPPPGAEPYENLPYWTHAASGLIVFAIGAMVWAGKHWRTRNIES